MKNILQVEEYTLSYKSFEEIDTNPRRKLSSLKLGNGNIKESIIEKQEEME